VLCVAAWCSVSQCVAVCYTMRTDVGVGKRSAVLQCVAVYCSVLQCVVVCCSLRTDVCVATKSAVS